MDKVLPRPGADQQPAPDVTPTAEVRHIRVGITDQTDPADVVTVKLLGCVFSGTREVLIEVLEEIQRQLEAERIGGAR